MAKALQSRASNSDDEATTAAQDGDDLKDDLETVDLETALAPRRQSGRRWRMRALLTLAPFLALMAIILVTIFGRFPIALTQLPFAPDSGAPAGSHGIAQQFTITSNVSYGMLTLNGKSLSGPPPFVVTLPPGYDTITLTAAPFQPVSCKVLSQYEPVIIDNGQASENSASCAIGGSYTASSLYTLYISLTGDDLPANQLAQARAALAQALARMPVYTATVPIGQYFATGTDRHGLPTGQRAAEPLRATLSIVPPPAAAQTANPIANPYDCPSHICSALTLLGPASSSQGSQSRRWRVTASVALHWRFTNGVDRVVGETTEDAVGPLDFTLTFDPQSGWRVSAWPASAPASAVGSIAHVLDPCALGDNFVTFGQSIQWIATTSSAPTPAIHGIMQGCAFQTNANGSATGAHYLYRFGVVLAVDAAAHTELPSLLMAPHDEIAAVAA
ncbi:MAG: hypothetical protein ABI274_02880 [Ktedonobacterales bacterium]